MLVFFGATGDLAYKKICASLSAGMPEPPSSTPISTVCAPDAALTRAVWWSGQGSRRQALCLSNLRYVGGVSDYLEVLDTQRVLYLAETDFARSRQDELIASVQLYRALGGGWSDDELLRLTEQPFEARR